jgi:hypothetical protein
MKILFALFVSTFLMSCSVVGQSDVDTAPYSLLKSDKDRKIEVRNYESMVLVSAPMSGRSGNSAFRALFAYISGENQGDTEIAMTAPVFMNDKSEVKEGTEIAMTAPVFMGSRTGEPMMSFVMPNTFTLATTPKPINPQVKVTELKNYKVAAIQFSGTLSDNNVEENTNILSKWIVQNGYTAISESIKAGYNGPLTLPFLRKNEVLIEVK